MNLDELGREIEDKAVEYLNATRLDDIEGVALNQLRKSAGNGYVRFHKLEFSALLNAVRGLHRQRQDLKQQLAEARRQPKGHRKPNCLCRFCAEPSQNIVSGEMIQHPQITALEEEVSSSAGEIEELEQENARLTAQLAEAKKAADINFKFYQDFKSKLDRAEALLRTLSGCMPDRIYVTDEIWSDQEPEDGDFVLIEIAEYFREKELPSPRPPRS